MVVDGIRGLLGLLWQLLVLLRAECCSPPLRLGEEEKN